MPVRALRKIQIADEAVKGTAIPATTIWRGVGTIQDNRTVVFVEEDIGSLLGVDRTYTPYHEGAISFEATPCTFEQLPHILDAALMDATPVQDGAGTGYVYTYNAPTTSLPTIATYTIEGGDDQQAEEMEYAFVTNLSISGSSQEAIMMSADWIGRQVVTTTFTAALSVPTVEEVLFQKAKLYIDASGGGVGTTQKTTTFLDFELSGDTGNRPLYTGDGNLYFEGDKNVGPDYTLTVTFEHDATGVAEIAAWRAETVRLIRIEALGSALTTPGAENNKRLTIDAAGKWESFEKIGERDGNDIVTGVLRPRYSSADTLGLQIVVVNELAALP